jgi:hypothetical protein
MNFCVTFVAVHSKLQRFLNKSSEAEELLPAVEKSVQFVGSGKCLSCQVVLKFLASTQRLKYDFRVLRSGFSYKVNCN